MNWLALAALVLTAGPHHYRCRMSWEDNMQVVECKRTRWEYFRCSRVRGPDGFLVEHCQDSDSNIWDCTYYADGSRQCWAR